MSTHKHKYHPPSQVFFGDELDFTPERFQNWLSLWHHKKCHLKDWGYFYFTFEKDDPENPNQKEVYLSFYNEKKQRLHSSPFPVFSSPENAKWRVSAFDYCTFVITDYWKGSTFLIMDNRWVTSKTVGATQARYGLMKALYSQSGGPNAHSLVPCRYAFPGDIFLISNDGYSVYVHSHIVDQYRKLLADALKSHVLKRLPRNRSLQLDCSAEVLEALVRFLYEEKLNLSVETAYKLITSPLQKVFIPKELQLMAVRELMKHGKTFEGSLHGWKKNKKAGKDRLRKNCARELTQKISNLAVLKGKLDRMSKEDLVTLIIDILSSFKDASEAKIYEYNHTQ